MASMMVSAGEYSKMSTISCTQLMNEHTSLGIALFVSASKRGQ